MMKSKKQKLIPELRFPEFKNDWEIKKFSQFIKLDRGSSPRPIQEYLTKDESGVNWIKIGDTKNSVNSVIYHVEEKITQKGAEKSRKVEKGELILANSMSFGKTYELAIDGYIYDGWFVLRNYENYYNKPFLLQLLNSDFIQNQYKRLSAGGIVQNISSDIVYNSKLFHTTLSEQKKIASCLSSLDEVISAHNQKLELLKDHKKGLMQNLFPQQDKNVPNFRFPEFKNDGDWEEKKLGEVGEIITGNTPSTTEVSNYGNEKLFVSPADINDNRYVYDTKTKLSELGFSKTRIIPANNVLFVCIGSTIGKVAQNKVECATNQQINSIIPSKEYSSDFLYSVLENSASQVSELAGIQAVPIINKSQFSNVKLFFPKIKEQQKIASCLSAVDHLITAQTEKIEQLKHHKKGLMQGLFPKIEN